MPLPDFLPDKTKRTSARIIMIRRRDDLVRQTFYHSAYKHTACSLNVSAHDGVSGLEKALTDGSDLMLERGDNTYWKKRKTCRNYQHYKCSLTMGPMAYQYETKTKIPSPAKTDVNPKQSNINKQCNNCKDNDMTMK